MFHHKHFMTIISSASGVGKSVIIGEVKKADGNLKFSVSATTRKPRSGEVDGEHYHFLSQDVFLDKVQKEEFLEYATVFGNYYGTLRQEIYSKFAEGFDVIMDIDWQGNRLISSQMNQEELLRIFILPPTMVALEERIRWRNEDEEAVIVRRLKEARNEISHYQEYDYVVVNDDLETSIKEVESLISAKRLGNTIESDVVDFVNKLLN
jgi:guanylate kinase